MLMRPEDISENVCENKKFTFLVIPAIVKSKHLTTLVNLG
jgi:siroheme synthase (precorrin-2 oxidase/ferrochelatase)